MAGNRVARMLEQPLVFLARRKQPTASFEVEEQWSRISGVLMHEVDRLQDHEQISIPQLKALVQQLGHLQCPPSISRADFGVIDIFISYGLGARLPPSSSYLVAPTLALNSSRILLLRPASRESHAGGIYAPGRVLPRSVDAAKGNETKGPSAHFNKKVLEPITPNSGHEIRWQQQSDRKNLSTSFRTESQIRYIPAIRCCIPPSSMHPFLDPIRA